MRREGTGYAFPLALAVTVLVAVSGCTSESTPPADEAVPGQAPLTLNERLVEARGYAESDFEREVLDRAIEEGEISAGDYAEAVERYVACAEDAGHVIDAVMQSDGIYRWEPRSSVDQSAYGDDTYTCAVTVGLASIESLYKLQVANPSGLPQEQAIAACLQDAGVVDGGYDGDAFLADREHGWDEASFDVTDPAALTCLTSLGIAVVS